MRRLTLFTIAAALLAAAPGALAATPENATYANHFFPSGDGTTLHAGVLRPKGLPETAKTPVILAIGPYFNHTGSTGVAGAYDPTSTEQNGRFDDLLTEGKVFERGYTVVYADLRGFGASEGCNDFGGPGEQADVKAAVEWAASRPWSTGKVGMWGKSYDGWTEVMALATKPKGLAATVIQSPIIDGYRTLYQNGVHYDSGWYATPALYQSIDAPPPSPFDEPEVVMHGALGTNPACYGANIVQQNTTIDRDMTGFWRARNLIPRAEGSTVPTLWSHGLTDANTKPDNFLDVWSTLRGPHHAWFGQYPHIRPQDKDDDGLSQTGREGFIDEAMRWMDRYVKGTGARVEQDPTVTVEDGGTQRYRAEKAWPPADTATGALTLRPGTVTDQPGNDGETGPGNGIWTLSQKLPHAVHLAGAPRVALEVATGSPRANLFALLYDVDAENRARLVTRGAYAVKGPGESARFELYPQDWTFKAGHRLAVLLAESDDGWYTPPPSFQPIEVLEGRVSFPALRTARTKFLPSRPSLFERERGEPFAVPEGAGEARMALPPRMKRAR